MIVKSFAVGSVPVGYGLPFGSPPIVLSTVVAPMIEIPISTSSWSLQDAEPAGIFSVSPATKGTPPNPTPAIAFWMLTRVGGETEVLVAIFSRVEARQLRQRLGSYCWL